MSHRHRVHKMCTSKVRFLTENFAIAAVVDAALREIELWYYPCHRCGGYHTTSREPGTNIIFASDLLDDGEEGFFDNKGRPAL